MRRSIQKQNRIITTDQGDIDCLFVVSSRRRTMEIQIQEDGQVCIRVPRFVSEVDIQKFIDSRKEWIERHRLRNRKRHQLIRQRKFDHGQEFLFLGKTYVVRVQETCVKRSRIDFDGQQWLIRVPHGLSLIARKEHVKRRMIQWYKEQAHEVFGGRLFHYARVMGESPQDIKIRGAKRVWGMCDKSRGIISLNWHLIMAPVDVIDYVVVHELAHLTHANHSKRFWNRVEKFFPHYKQKEQWLKDHTIEMSLPT